MGHCVPSEGINTLVLPIMQRINGASLLLASVPPVLAQCTLVAVSLDAAKEQELFLKFLLHAIACQTA